MIFNIRVLVVVAGAILSIGGAAASSINDVPPCGISCAQTAATAVGCNLSDSDTDRSCVCSHQSFSDATNACARASCPHEDIGPVAGGIVDYCETALTSSSASASSTTLSSTSQPSTSVSASATLSHSSSVSTLKTVVSTTSEATTRPTTETRLITTTLPSTTAAPAAGALSVSGTSLGLSSGSDAVVVATVTLPTEPTDIPSSALGVRAVGVVGLGFVFAVLVLVQFV